MKRFGINMYTTSSSKKASIIERFNRTLKTKMFKRFHLQGNYNWVKMLPTLINEYNNTKHRTINMKPAEVLQRKGAIEHLLRTAYRRRGSSKPGKFKVGDIVRISKIKGTFEKGYQANWSTELFRVVKVIKTQPVTYLIADLEGDVLTGSFYEYELKKTKYPNEYLIEKILKRRGDRVLVKWLGFTTPTYELASNIL